MLCKYYWSVIIQFHKSEPVSTITSPDSSKLRTFRIFNCMKISIGRPAARNSEISKFINNVFKKMWKNFCSKNAVSLYMNVWGSHVCCSPVVIRVQSTLMRLMDLDSPELLDFLTYWRLHLVKFDLFLPIPNHDRNGPNWMVPSLHIHPIVHLLFFWRPDRWTY